LTDSRDSADRSPSGRASVCRRPAVRGRINARALTGRRRLRDWAAMQTQAFAPSHPRSHPHTLQPIQVVHALAVDGPAFAPQQDVDTQATKPEPRRRQLPAPHPQRRLIPDPASADLGRALQHGQPTRLQHLCREALPNPVSERGGGVGLRRLLETVAGCAGPASGRPPDPSAGHSHARIGASRCRVHEPAGSASFIST
jgi:hypothetical protein